MNLREQTTNIDEYGVDKSYDFESLLLKTELFKKDREFFFLLKKTERIISAIYLLTDLISDREPVKWLLREFSMKIIPEIVSMRGSFGNIRESDIENLENNTLKLLAFLESSYIGGIISKMNFAIFSEELIKLINLEREYFKKISKERLIRGTDKIFFLDSDKAENIKSIKDKPMSYEYTEKTKRHFIKDTDDRVSEKDTSIKGQNANKRTNQGNILKKERKNERQLKIIDLIKDKINISIKDITENIKDCSEKTIQRELLLMVKSGVLKKEGKKRWSKYSLNL